MATSLALERPAATAGPVPLVDLRAEYAAMKDEIDAAIAAVIAHTAFIRGPFARRLEEEWAAFCGASHAVGCANGTVAIQLALEALGVGAGDEVVTTPLTFIATVEAIAHTGATPVLADVDPATGNLSPAAARAAVTARTRAIVPVALYGQPADMGAFRAMA
ncbi:MAG TPA: DegT/DnrJ/EryC1/StrS family aminotransferase, partial [Chloroflexota bacterium]|nr:DegT/DnrJ/EryC1/StrS family aminotransferase [Chloroflexota bacterium]